MGVKCPKCHFDNPSDSKFCKECGTQIIPLKEIPVTETLEKPTDKLTRGTTFASRYEIIEELGKGGMGNVYRAEDTKINEEVALKLIKPEIAADKKTINRFRNELKFARKIRHKNVCQMFDLGEEEGTHYITMEYIPGEDLKSMIKMSGQIAVGKAVKIAKQVTEGLNEAHQLGIVHRDLKPNNVMIDKEGNAHIMDFGIARSLEAEGVTEAGMMIGTPEYMSPEQVEGEEVDQRSDIYSLGVMLFEMLTGQVPFAGKTPISIAMKQKSETPKNPREINAQIPEGLSLMILRCMEKEKDKRYQNEEEVLAELNRIEKEIPTQEKIIERRRPSFQSFFNTLKERKMLETLAAFIGGGVIILEVVHWILIDHYHFPEESLDITIITLLCALICTLIWRFFKGVERKARKIKAEIILISIVILATVFFDALLILKIEKPVSEPVSERILSTHKQLTFTGNAYYPAISPDGSFIAYVNNTAFEKAKLIVQDLLSNQALEIFSADNIENLRWNPDGSEISILAKQDSSLTSLNISRLGGPPREMESSALTAWSPDGTQIAGAWYADKKIRILNKSTGDSSSFYLNGPIKFVGDIDWSPAGNLLLVLTRNENNRNVIWTVRTDGSDQNKVIEEIDEISSPRWSSKGNAIYYLFGKDRLNEVWKIPVSPDSGKPTKSPYIIISGFNFGRNFTLSRDGKQLAYTRQLQYANLILAKIKGAGTERKVETKQLTTGTLMHEGAIISPDGTQIAFARGDGQKSNIYVMPIDGGEAEQITFLNSRSTNPVWSPDGKWIAFGSNERGAYKVWKVRSQGGRPFQFDKTALSISCRMAWHPKSFILYQKEGHRNFQILDPESGEEKALVKDESVGFIFYPIYSPDGKKVAVSWNRKPKRGIWVISLEDFSQKFLYEGIFYMIEWSSDGNWIHAYDKTARKYIQCELKTGQVRELPVLPFKIEGRSYYKILNEKPLVVMHSKALSDVWLVENFDPEIK